jgi:hypothetical protein
MAISGIEKDAALHDREIKTRRVALRARISGNATPASKVHRGEAPAVAVLRSQGKVAEADAVEDLSASFTAADDATGKFGVLLKASQLGDIDRIIGVSAVALDGGSATAALVSCGGAQAGLSPAGNVAIDVDSSKNLSSADCDVLLVLDYYLK